MQIGRFALCAAAFLLAFLCGALPSPAQTFSAPTFSAPMDLTQGTPGPHSPAAIAVDANGYVNVSWSSGQSYQTLFFTRSTDSGKTFPAPTTVWSGVGTSPAEEVDSPAVILVDASGNINLFWWESYSDASTNSGGIDGYMFSRSTDGGASFSAAVNLWQSFGIMGYDWVTAALDPSGAIDLAWWTNTTTAVLFARSTDGVNFTQSSVEPNTGDFNEPYGAPSIAFDSQGTTYVLWEAHSFSGAGCAYELSSSQNSAATFSSPLFVPGTSCYPLGTSGAPVNVLSVDSAGGIDILRGPDFYRSVDGGQTFSATPGASQNVVPASGNLAADSNANLDASWLGSVPPSTSANIYFDRSTDHGATFSAPQQINTQAYVGSNRYMLLDSSGNPDFLWESSAVLGAAQVDILLARSADAGKTFASPQTINTAPARDYSLAAALDPAGNIYATWLDSATNDVFFSRGVVSGFAITAAPAAQTVLPGGAANFTLTLTPAGGFAGAVNLSCANLPSGATCAFTPPSLPPNGSPSPVTLTIAAPPTIAPGNYSITVSAASGGITQTQTVQLAVGGIVSSISPTSATVAAGSSASFALALGATGGFSGPVTLVCSAPPAGTACSFNPPQLTLAPSGTSSSTLTVSVASPPSVSIVPRPKGNWLETVSRELPLVTACVALFATLIAFAVVLSAATNLSWSQNYALRLVVSRSRELLLGFASFAGVLVLAIGLISCSGATTKTSSSSTNATGTSATGTGATGTTGSTGTSGSTGGSSGGGGSSGSGSSGSGSGGSGGAGAGSGSGSGSGGSVTSQIVIQAQSNGATVTLGTISITIP